MKSKKKRNFIFSIFIIINLLFIFLQIHKQSNLVKIYFEKQRLENEKDGLTNEKNRLMQDFYEKKNPTNIREYAMKNLNMQKMKLTQVKKLKINE